MQVNLQRESEGEEGETGLNREIELVHDSKLGERKSSAESGKCLI